MSVAEVLPGRDALAGPDISDDFRLAMRRLASAVAVITAARGEEWIGMTATTVTSLSKEPPALLVCNNRKAAIHAVLAPGKAFSVNLLAQEQHGVSAAFGGSANGRERFDQGEWIANSDGIPELAGAVAAISCVAETTMAYATHTIVVGKVRHARLSGSESPLIYLNGQYL